LANDEAPADQPAFPMEPAARKRALWTIAFTLFLDLMAFGMILPVLPYYAEDFGASPVVVALLSTAFSLAQFVSSPILGRISDRRGRRPVMLISLLGSLFSALVLGFAHALWVVFLARLVSGIMKANVSTAHAYVADIVEPSQRAKYMGLMGAALGMGFVFGPAIGGLLSTESMPTLPFFAAAALNLVNLIMAVFWLPETHFKRGQAGDRDPLRASQVWKSMRGQAFGTLIVITFVYYLAFAAMESTFALFTEYEFDWGAQQTGLFLTFIGLIIALSQGIMVGKLVARIREEGTLTLGIGSLGIGLGLLGGLPHLSEWLSIPIISSDGSITGIAIFVFGFIGFFTATGNGLMMAPISSLVSKTSDPRRIGFNMGVKESASALARISGPVLAGILFEVIEPGAPMIAGSAFCLLNLVLAMELRRRLRREGFADDAKG
jgi:multidrug resistance protein